MVLSHPLNFLLFISVFISYVNKVAPEENFNRFQYVGKQDCNVNPRLKKEIASYQPIVNRIIDSVLNGKYKGVVYDEIGKFVDTFGSRLSGTENLENSIQYVLGLIEKYGLENVHGEPAMIPHWVRGEESAFMVSPRKYKLDILGLGSSVGTPKGGITADIIVVKSFDELHRRANEAVGKIVVYNQDWVSYPVSVVYRTNGASEASRVGAVASLIRSVTPFSIGSVHTGSQTYQDGVKPIPTACITVEDAEMLNRITDRGTKVTIHLEMGAHTLPDVESQNTVGELVGRAKKDKVVIVSGHLDSWDVGQGAMDDAAGAFVSWFSVAVLKNLGLRPRRTIRAVLWTAEEPGLVGARQYAEQHKNDLHNIDLVIESDEGTFNPVGIEFSGEFEATCIMKEILGLFKPFNFTKFSHEKYVGSDITQITKYGVPGAALITENEKYFYFHHTNGDMLTVENSIELDRNVAFHAAFSYVVADIGAALPRRKYQVES